MRWPTCVLCFLLMYDQAWAGNIRGEVVLESIKLEKPKLGQIDAHFWHLGSRSSQVSPATIWVIVEGPNVANLKEINPQQAIMNIQGYELWPPLVLVRVGSTIEIKNNDDHSYSCQATGGPDSFAIADLKAGKTQEHKFLSSGMLRIRCLAYPFMHATILATESPLRTQVDQKGRFLIKNVPGGDYSVKAYANHSLVAEQAVSVPAFGTARVTLDGKQMSPAKTPKNPQVGSAAPATTPKSKTAEPIQAKPTTPNQFKTHRQDKQSQTAAPGALAPTGEKAAQTSKPSNKKIEQKTERKKSTGTASAQHQTDKKKPIKKARRKPKKEPKPAFRDEEPEIEIELEE